MWHLLWGHQGAEEAARKTGSQGPPYRRAAPATPRTPSQGFQPSAPTPLPAPSAPSRPCHPESQHTLKASGSGVGGRGRVGRIPGPVERTRARRTLHPNSPGCRVPGDHPAKTKRRNGRGQGSLGGGGGAVPRRRGDGTPPWWRRVSRGAELWAGQAPRPRTGLGGGPAPVHGPGRSPRRPRLCVLAVAPPSFPLIPAPPSPLSCRAPATGCLSPLPPAFLETTVCS